MTKPPRRFHAHAAATGQKPEGPMEGLANHLEFLLVLAIWFRDFGPCPWPARGKRQGLTLPVSGHRLAERHGETRLASFDDPQRSPSSHARGCCVRH